MHFSAGKVANFWLRTYFGAKGTDRAIPIVGSSEQASQPASRKQARQRLRVGYALLKVVLAGLDGNASRTLKPRHPILLV